MSDFAVLPLGYPVCFLEQKAGNVQQVLCVPSQKERVQSPVDSSKWLGRKKDMQFLREAL